MDGVFNAADVSYQEEKYKNLGASTNSFVSVDHSNFRNRHPELELDTEILFNESPKPSKIRSCL